MDLAPIAITKDCLKKNFKEAITDCTGKNCLNFLSEEEQLSSDICRN